MSAKKWLAPTIVAVLLSVGSAGLFPFAVAQSTAATPSLAVGPQYDTTHVYVAPEDFDHFVASVVATFGGTTSKQGVFTV
ncbi:MAG: glyoxalase, partial [Terracidiphilus sp.]